MASGEVFRAQFFLNPCAFQPGEQYHSEWYVVSCLTHHVLAARAHVFAGAVVVV